MDVRSGDVFDDGRDKCVIVLAEGLAGGVAVNVAAVLALAVGVRVGFPLGGDLTDGSGVEHAGLPSVGLPLLRAAASELVDLRGRADNKGLLVVDYTEAARSPVYEEYGRALAALHTYDHTYLGIALAGRKRAINSVAGNLKLFR